MRPAIASTPSVIMISSVGQKTNSCWVIQENLMESPVQTSLYTINYGLYAYYN